jgi:hypothetical protein
MADTFLSLSDLNSLFFKVTCAIYGLDASAPANQSKIRESWPTDGQPAWKIHDDVTFLRIGWIDDPYNRQREVRYEPIFTGDPSAEDPNNLIQQMQMTNVNQIYWTIYGPNSYVNAWKIWNQLYYQSIKEMLRLKNVFLIPDIPAPQRVPESFQGQWWERCDLSARFNALTVFESIMPTIRTVAVQTTDSQKTISQEV